MQHGRPPWPLSFVSLGEGSWGSFICSASHSQFKTQCRCLTPMPHLEGRQRSLRCKQGSSTMMTLTHVYRFVTCIFTLARWSRMLQPRDSQTMREPCGYERRVWGQNGSDLMLYRIHTLRPAPTPLIQAFGAGMFTIPLIAQCFCGMAAVTCSSRTLYAFSRDR